jgi:hypothetical protein
MLRYGPLLVAMVVGGGIAYAFWPQSDTQAVQAASGPAAFESGDGQPVETTNSVVQKKDEATDQSVDEPQESADERMAREIVGRWKTKRDSGPRDLVMKADGTAKMTVNIESTVGRLLFQTKQMVMNIDWRIENSILHFRMVDGKPKTSVDLLIKSYGDSAKYPILECSTDRLLVKDDGSDPDHDWSRVPN